MNTLNTSIDVTDDRKARLVKAGLPLFVARIGMDSKSGGVDSKSADRKRVLEWTAPHVVSFIRSLNPAFHTYVTAFERDAVDGSILAHDISDKWLTANIPNELHRTRIAREIAALKQFIPVEAGASVGGDTKHDAVVLPSVPPTVTTLTSRGWSIRKIISLQHNKSVLCQFERVGRSSKNRGRTV